MAQIIDWKLHGVQHVIKTTERLNVAGKIKSQTCHLTLFLSEQELCFAGYPFLKITLKHKCGPIAGDGNKVSDHIIKLLEH